MQKFRVGDGWWAFDARRGWLSWEASRNDWMPQPDGPFPWTKSPFKRSDGSRPSKRQAALESLTPTNREEARLLERVLSEPAIFEPDRADVSAAAVSLVPQTPEERRLPAHIVSPREPLTTRPVIEPPPPYSRFLWIMKVVTIGGGIMLAVFIGWLALGLFNALFLPW